jgi:hypothetical protein
VADADLAPNQGVAPGVDLAYEKYADTALLQVALRSVDPDLLIDAALQLQAGEQALLRPHRNVTSEQLLQLATGAAAETRSKAALERIAKAAVRAGNETLAKQAQAALALGAATRAADPAWEAIEKAGGKEYVVASNFRVEIGRARLRNEPEVIVAAKDAIAACEDLSDKAKEYLRRLATEAEANLPTASTASADLLVKLSASSRGLPARGPVYGSGRGYVVEPPLPLAQAGVVALDTTGVPRGNTVRFGVRQARNGADYEAEATMAVGGSGRTHVWDDKWLYANLPVNSCLVMAVRNLDRPGDFYWVAIENTQKTWFVRTRDGRLDALGNERQFKRTLFLNGARIDFDVYNPANTGGVTANHIYYGFGF